ncbi:MAG: sugar-binding domain-containing protein [Ferruginibacter sp.]
MWAIPKIVLWQLNLNITPYLNDGENIISVWVIRWSDGSFLEDQDGWRLEVFTEKYIYWQNQN